MKVQFLHYIHSHDVCVMKSMKSNCHCETKSSDTVKDKHIPPIKSRPNNDSKHSNAKYTITILALYITKGYYKDLFYLILSYLCAKQIFGSYCEGV